MPNTFNEELTVQEAIAFLLDKHINQKLRELIEKLDKHLEEQKENK